MCLLNGCYKLVLDLTSLLTNTLSCLMTCVSLITTSYIWMTPGIDHDNVCQTSSFLSTLSSLPKNDTGDQLNHTILDRVPGEETIHMSVDKVTHDDSHIYPVEFLNSLNASRLPLAHLALKPGHPLMLLHNLNPSNGLCNGTCMVLLDVITMVLRCQILGGDHAGKVGFIPRMTLDPNAETLPIPLTHCQFPVCLGFVMTINKAQGQSIFHVGIDLQTPVFSDGQLYVALSCCTSKDRIKVVFPEDSDTTSTKNIVYTEVLSGIINS